MPEENGPAVPELARRATLSSCRHDPVRAFAPVLTAMPGQRDPARRHPRRLRLRPPRRRRLGHPARAAGAQLVQDLHPHDRGPKGTHDGAIISNGNLYCPRHTPPAAGTRAARPHRHQRAGRGPRPQDRRAGPVQARPPHRRRRRRLPPGAVPRRHGQDPLPAPPRVDDAGPGPARDPAAPGTPPGLLHPADHHRPAGRARQDRAETRLPVRGLAPLLRPPHRRRTRLRHRQGPRHQRHQPRLVPPHGPGTPDAVHHDPAHRPQPAHPGTPGTPGRKKTSAAPPPGCPRKPANGAARPSPASPPGRPDPQPPPTTSPAPVTTSTDSHAPGESTP